MRNQLYRLCHEEGIFHGLPFLATSDSLARVFVAAELFLALRKQSKHSECQAPKWLGRFHPCQQQQATFDWPPQANIHDQMHFAFRGEFRPLGILQTLFSAVSHPYRGNTTGLILGCLLGLRVWFSVVVLCPFPIITLCFLSFYDDLGTPPTWRPHSWKKKMYRTLDQGCSACNPAW